MGHGLVRGKDASDAITCLAVNGHFAVVTQHCEVLLLPTNLGAHDLPRKAAVRGFSQRQTVCSLSAARASRLAFSRGSQILVTENGVPDVLLAGNGRAVTSLSWSCGDVDVIASGTVDGTICLWNITKPLRPVARVVSGSSPCRLLQFSPSDHSLFASCHANGPLRIWKASGRFSVSELTVLKTDDPFIALSWHPDAPGRIATASSRGGVEVWDLSSKESSSYNTTGSSYSIVRAWSYHDVKEAMQQIIWVGSDNIAALAVSGKEIHVLGTGDYGTTSGKLLHFALRETLGQAQRISLSEDYTVAALIAFDGNKFYRYSLPVESPSNPEQPREDSHVLPKRSTEQMRSLSDDERAGEASAIRATKAVIDTQYDLARKDLESSMTYRSNLTSALSAPLKMQEVSLEHQRELPGSNAAEPRRESAASASPLAMTKSLELPSSREDVSSMPFLSPGVPGKNASIDGNIQLPPLEDIDTLDLQDSSTHTPQSLASFGTNEDSDSEYETFHRHGLDGSGSGTLLPGGINVPLPKACGAIFAPNGQLLTFFRAKPPATLTTEDDYEAFIVPEPGNARRTAKIFPSFGDLFSINQEHEHSSDDSSMGSADVDAGRSFSQFRQAPWTARAAPLKEAHQPATDPRRVNINVSEISGLSNYARNLTSEYRFTSEGGECVSDVCRWNARVACSVRSTAVADIWEILALITECKRTDSPLGNSEAKTITGAQSVKSMQYEGRQPLFAQDLKGMMSWSGHPFGSRWLMDQIFVWAEQLADIQLLAYMSALVMQQDFDVTTAPSYRPTSGQIPVLRADALREGDLRESPTKIEQRSQPPSRQISQPETPLLDTASSTPPLAFPSLYRQSSRLSASGSASPEHQRSSFSAAARSYAQSITDRFATYGTSPPAKKLSSSPGNELSTSFPTTGSSWSKSVSFAPSTTTATGSTLSVAVGRAVDDDGYDSDRTIEDSSLPPTPKGGGPVLVSVKNHDAFADEVTSSLQQQLLPRHVLAKSKVWRRHHAEQLRAWGLLQQAAEIEDGSGRSYRNGWDAGTEGYGSISVKVTCGICECIIERLAQICPRCSFTTHAGCSQSQRQELRHESNAGPSCSCCGSDYK